MAATNSTVIYIDPQDKAIHYYGNTAGKITHDTANYKSRDFDSEFFTAFVDILGNFMKKYTPAQSVNSTIVMPDSVILTDLMTLPAMKSGALNSTIETNLSGMYKNRSDLIYVFLPVLSADSGLLQYPFRRNGGLSLVP